MSETDFDGADWPDEQEEMDAIFRDVTKRLRLSLARRRRNCSSWSVDFDHSVVVPVAERVVDALIDAIGDMRRIDDPYQEWFASELERLWGIGFESLRLLKRTALQLNRQTIDTSPGSDADPKLHALLQVHARSLVVYAEVCVLLESGYAWGAFARWRSMHELAVIARILHDGSAATARRYLAQKWVEIADAAERGTLLGARGRQSSEERRIVADLIARRAELLERHGSELRNAYGWAARVLKKKKPTFEDLEAKARLRRRRALYKHASKLVHASAGGDWFTLSDHSMPATFFVGARLDDIADVGIRSSVSLAEVTAYMLGTRRDWGNNDELDVWVEVMWQLAKEAEIDFRRAQLQRSMEIGTREVDAVQRHAP